MFRRHLSQYVVFRGTPAVLNLAALAAFTALLAPAEYGRYATLMAAVALTVTVSISWVQGPVVRFWAGCASHAEKRALGATLTVAFLAAQGVIVLCAAGSWWMHRSEPDALAMHLVFVLLCVAQGCRGTLLDLERARLATTAYGALTLVPAALMLALGVAVLRLGGGPLGLAGVTVCAELGPCVLPLWRERRHLAWRDFDASVLAAVARYGVPLAASNLLTGLVGNGTRLVLNAVSGPGAAGLYSAAYDLTQRSITVAMQMVQLSAAPLIFRAGHERDRSPAAARAFDELLRRNLVYTLLLGLPMTIALAAYPGPLAGLLLGSAFAQAAPSLIPAIAAATFLARLKANHLDITFLVAARTERQIAAVAAAAATSLLLTPVLAGRFAERGAAAATLAGFAVACLVSWSLGRRVLPLPFPAADTIRVSVAGAAMAALLWLSPRLDGPAALVPVAGAGLAFGLMVLALDVDGLGGQLRVRYAAALRRRGRVRAADGG